MVPAKGVERWLSQRLSHRLGAAPGAGDGVCAGVRFTSPRSLVAAVLGLTDDDPWAADAMAWPLLAVLDDSLDEAWCAPVARHLGHFDTGAEAELRRGRRYAVSARLAAPLRRVRRTAADAAGRLARRPGHGRPRRRPRRRPGLAARAVAPSRRPGRRPAAAPAARGPWSGCATSRRRSICPSDCRCSARPGCRSPRSSCSTRWRRTATCTCGCRIPATRSGTRSPRHSAGRRGAVDRAEDDARRRPPAAGHPRPRRPRAAAGAGRRRRDRRRATPMHKSPDTLLGWLQTTCAATRVRPGARRAADDRSCRCTPATGRPARSTCSARCCSGCSRLTRRSSRATSW